MSTKETDSAVDQLLADKGISYNVKYVGETSKRDAGEKPWQCDQWQVIFDTKTGPHKEIREDYYTGLGLRKKGRHLISLDWKQPDKPQKPSAASVLYSLLLDGEACSMSFADWCDNFGYDTDSIKALNTYQQCERIGASLRKLFDRETQEQLRKLLEDY